MKWRQYGRNAVLVEFADDPDQWAYHKCRAVTEALARRPPVRLIEFVPGYTTVLLEFDLSGGASLDNVTKESVDFLTEFVRSKTPPTAIKTIPVLYDGPDLDRVARHNRISVAQVIKFHSEPTYNVYLLGFSPGFPYLGQLHHRLHTPRLETPRLKVAAGSVAIGGKHTGIYSVDSPGGWNIIGRTETKVFDVSKAGTADPQDAFFLKPGDRVRFLPVR